MMKPNLPTLNEKLCNGCADCVAVCPTECLAMQSEIPCLVRPLDCIDCALCEIICPEDAIKMEPMAES